MAMAQNEQDFVQRIRTLSSDALILRGKIEKELALYDGKGFGAGITTPDFESIPSLSHLTQSEMWNAVSALQSIFNLIDDLDATPGLDLVKFEA